MRTIQELEKLVEGDLPPDIYPHLIIDEINNCIKFDRPPRGEREMLTIIKYKLLMKMKDSPNYVVDENPYIVDPKNITYDIMYKGTSLTGTKIPRTMVEQFRKHLT